MTVIYSSKVATANFSCFFKLLMRWRGSIYKILWKEFAVFSLAYYLLSFLYQYILTENLKKYFELGAQYCSQFNNLIPVAFVLGFYVNHVANRWWEKFRTLPWPGRMAMYVTAHLHGHDERARLMRRTIMRYMCLSYVMTMSSISPPVKKRFPNLSKMLEAGFMLPNEETVIDNIKTPYNKFFVPLVWASAVVTRARKEGRIKDDFAVKTLIDEINDYRTRSFQLFNFDWVTIPLVYTQVVTLAVYTFFLSCLMGRQHLDNGHSGDMIFPFFTFLQFLFYLGWLKVAETMLNPFGEDDDDFDINYLIDRHLKVSYLVVDEMHNEHPDLIRDQYWDSIDFQLPYTEDSEPHLTDPLKGSAIDISIRERKGSLFPSSLSRIEEEDGGPGFTVGSYNPKKLVRTSSKASNVSKMSHSLKPPNFVRAIKRSFSQNKRNSSDDSFSMTETQNSTISPLVRSPRSVPKKTNNIEIVCPDDQTEEGIFRMSLEDVNSVVFQKDNKSFPKKDPQASSKFSKPLLHGSSPKRKGLIRRNNTDSTLEVDRGKDGFRNFAGKFPLNHRSSVNQSIAEEEENSTPLEEDEAGRSHGMFVDDMMQELRRMQRNESYRHQSQQASYNSQAEIMNLLKNSLKSDPPCG